MKHWNSNALNETNKKRTPGPGFLIYDIMVKEVRTTCHATVSILVSDQ